MDEDDTDRLTAELDLLSAIYPTELQHDPKASELKYTDASGTLVLRLPPDYPSSKPTVLSASLKPSGADVRDRIREALTDLPTGEEALDIIIASFRDIASDSQSTSAATANTSTPSHSQAQDSPLTIIIWLHHLLAASKRKLALHPPSSTPPISGITKPGYPGVLIYSGPSTAVRELVREVRSLNWQAFQVRYEESVKWEFVRKDGNGGVREVERMADVVEGVEEEWRGTLVGVLGIA